MTVWTKVVGVSVLAPLLVLSGFAAAGAVPGGHRGAGRAVAPRAAAAVGLNSAQETAYVPVTPCRIVDTRQAVGALKNGVTRTYYVGGTTGFAPQGGKSGGCGVPVGATSIAATVTAVSPTGGGFLRAWPANETEPGATLLNYPAHLATGTGSTISLQSTVARSLKVKNYGGPTQLVVDVQGYYLPPIAADINGDGSFYGHTTRVLSVSHPGTGQYQVGIDRTVEGVCAAQVTAVGINQVATAFAQGSSVYVDLSAVSGGTPINAEFNLTVTC